MPTNRWKTIIVLAVAFVLGLIFLPAYPTIVVPGLIVLPLIGLLCSRRQITTQMHKEVHNNDLIWPARYRIPILIAFMIFMWIIVCLAIYTEIPIPATLFGIPVAVVLIVMLVVLSLIIMIGNEKKHS